MKINLKKCAAAALIAAQAASAGAVELSRVEKAVQTGSLGSFYDGGGASAAPAAGAVSGRDGGPAAPLLSVKADAAAPEAAVPSPSLSGPRMTAGETGAGWGAVHGAIEGSTMGLLAVLSPAVYLVSEGFGRRMSRSYDGARSDNGNGTLYEGAGIALAAVLYVPALAVGAAGAVVGAAAGAVSELFSPGSTQKWDGEAIFG